jgi:hypothetical protein
LYRTTLENLLSQVKVPFNLLSLGSARVDRLAALYAFYADIVSCLTSASRLCLSCRRTVPNQYNVPGWNTFVKEKHEEARQSYLLWLEQGKPRFGVLYDA